LKSRGFKRDEIRTVEKIWKIKNKKNKLNPIYKIILKIKNSNSDLKKYRFYNSLIDISHKNESYFLKALILSASYSEIGNQGLFYKNFENLLSINSTLYGLDLKQSYVNEENVEIYYEVLNFLISKIQKNIRDEVILKMFESNFQFLNNYKKRVKFVNEGHEWSLNEIRELMKTYRYGHKFPAYWVNQLLGRTAVKEVNDYVQTFNQFDFIKFLNPIDFWIFKDNYPTNDKSRKIIVEKLIKNKENYGLTKYVILSLLENPIFKKSISKKDEKLLRPVFSLRRKFFHESLKNGKESSLIVYKLLKMGEESDEFFWWLLL
jgi:hypothetical protein